MPPWPSKPNTRRPNANSPSSCVPTGISAASKPTWTMPSASAASPVRAAPKPSPSTKPWRRTQSANWLISCAHATSDPNWNHCGWKQSPVFCNPVANRNGSGRQPCTARHGTATSAFLLFAQNLLETPANPRTTLRKTFQPKEQPKEPPCARKSLPATGR